MQHGSVSLCASLFNRFEIFSSFDLYVFDLLTYQCLFQYLKKINMFLRHPWFSPGHIFLASEIEETLSSIDSPARKSRTSPGFRANLGGRR